MLRVRSCGHVGSGGVRQGVLVIVKTRQSRYQQHDRPGVALGANLGLPAAFLEGSVGSACRSPKGMHETVHLRD